MIKSKLNKKTLFKHKIIPCDVLFKDKRKNRLLN